MDEYKKFTEICNRLPEYVRSFFIAKGDNYRIKTKLGYANDFTTFFNWILLACSDKTQATNIEEITYKELESLSYDDIDAYMDYLTRYETVDKNGKKIISTNSADGKARKLASIRMLYKFLLKRKCITFNPTELTETPKSRDSKAIITLSEEQLSKMLSKAYLAQGKPVKKEGQTERGIKKSESMRQRTKYRDFALLTTLLSSGIRVSELCNLNMYDIDFSEQFFIVTRKGGSQDKVYFGTEAKEALLDYIENERYILAGYTKDAEKYGKFINSDGPLFITGYIKGTDELKRVTPRRVQQIVKEYASFVAPQNEKITPHTLRKTFGTSLYREYKDLMLVQHALGHANSSTTSKYYVGFDEDNLKVIKNRKIE